MCGTRRQAHLLACERGRPGERYILGCENLTLAEILRKLAAITGRQAPRVKLPYAVAYAAGVVTTGWARMTGTAAAGAARRGPHGEEENVGVARKGEAGTGFCARAGGCGAGARGGMVSGERLLLIAAEPREFSGLVAVLPECEASSDWPVHWARVGGVERAGGAAGRQWRRRRQGGAGGGCGGFGRVSWM